MSAGSSPSTSMAPSRATSVTDGRRPTKDQRPHRSACSTDSSRKPGSAPTMRRNAATGVVRSASTSRQTGTTVCCRARARNSSGVGRITGSEGPEEAGVVPRVARAGALLLDLEEQHVAVAVVVRLADPLALAGGLALDPDLLARPAPVRHAAGVERLAQRGCVHPRHHQHLAGAELLRDRRDEAGVVVADAGQLFL